MKAIVSGLTSLFSPFRKFRQVHPHIGFVTPSVHNAADHIFYIILRESNTLQIDFLFS